MSGLFIRFEMVKAMSTTESLLFVVGRMFSGSKSEPKQLESVDDMMAFARMVNGG
ncbi:MULTISPECIES: hypothetical protein [unclassified Methylobacterium]|nr:MULTISPECIES: hypothetical protein [unclassified Methylobacterium]GBU16870.1 hypothetical protein AwMethylo_10850 [Methylobacterium sp.]